MKLFTALSAIIVGCGMVFGVALLYSVPVWLLWNHVLTKAVPVVNAIGFWQALGLTVLFSLLFKSSNISSSE